MSQSNAAAPITSNKLKALLPQPRKMGAVMDEAFDLLKRYFFILIVPSALLILPTHLLLTYLEIKYLTPAVTDLTAQGDNADLVRAFATAAGYILIGSPSHAVPGIIGIFMPILASSAAAAIVADIASNRTVSVTRSLINLARRGSTVLGIALLGVLCTAFVLMASLAVMLIIAILTLLVLGLLSAVSTDILPPALAVFMALVILLSPYFITTWFISRTFLLSIPVAVLENRGVLDAATRSQQLAKVARAGGVTALLPLLIYALQIALAAGSTAAIALFGLSPQINFSVSSAAGALVTCIVQTFWMVFIANLYLESRVRREALDIRLMLASEEATS